MRTLRLVCITLLFASTFTQAAVKTEETSKIQFSGMMGRMVNMFGGKAAREGVTETVAVKGNRKLTMGDNTAQIVDLDEEKVYDLDLKNNSYKVTTFEEIRRRMQEAQERARKESQKQGAQPQAEQGKQMEVDFDLKETGQKRNISGYDCREVVMTIGVHEKGKTMEQSGGMVLTAHNWLAPKVDAMKEIAEFDRRYYEKLAGPFGLPNAEQMAAAVAMYPYMKDAMERFQKENVNMDGTPILMTMTMEAVASPEQAAQQQVSEQKKNETTLGVPSMRGMLGGIGKRIADRKGEQKKDEAQTAPGRASIMTMEHEIKKISTDVSDSELAIPAGFKEKK